MCLLMVIYCQPIVNYNISEITLWLCMKYLFTVGTYNSFLAILNEYRQIYCIQIYKYTICITLFSGYFVIASLMWRVLRNTILLNNAHGNYLTLL